MSRFGRGFLGRRSLPGPSGFEQPIPQPVPPSATTNAATGVGATGATLNGTVNPNGLATNYQFQWGTTTGYGNTTTLTSAGSGTGNVPVSAVLSGLTTGQTYHFRVTATNADGTTLGGDQTFTPAVLPTAVTATGKGEPVVIGGDRFSIRHVGPAAAVWPDSPGQQFTVLGASTMVARPLPQSNIPTSPDFVAGSWTGRLGDSGEATLLFPNKEASDGRPWRQRFDPTGHLQWVEIYRNEELESCCLVDQVPTVDRQQVQIHGSDGWWLLKKAYERDWIVTEAPRDVIERGTQMWVPVVADNFSAPSSIAGATLTTPYGSWGILGTGGTVTVGRSGGAVIADSASTAANMGINSNTFPVSATNVWRATANFGPVNFGTAGNLWFQVSESSGNYYVINLFPGSATLQSNGLSGVLGRVGVPAAPSYSISLESDGEWIWGFVNGQSIGCFRRIDGSTTSLYTVLQMVNSSAGSACSATITSVLVESQQPFLQRGADKGDYVLPGTASTYPNGGLHARYFNDNDLQSDTNAINKVLAPTRTNAYLGSGGPQYMDQQDATVNFQNPPGFTQTSPGAGSSTQAWWSAVWFGAIYLKLSGGNYSFTLLGPGQGPFAVRVWIGKTKLGDQLVDQWAWNAASSQWTFTVSATTLAGTLPYGAGTVARDGWYPIKIEYAVEGTACPAPRLRLTSAPVNYTDPGGTAITTAYNNTVPATSLSPLGCVDQRYQGISHYDLVQQTGQAYGYQLSVEPKQLESGLFPGVLAPRIREGHDTDLILAPDNGPGQDGEGILNYSSGLDATDFASSLWGNGAGFQNGNTGQLQANVFDPGTMLASLCDVQQWTDFSDASFASLLQALLNSQLSLQLSPWQLLSADPNGRPRQSFTWPITGTMAKMNWRPGDGLRIQALDINVWDTTPRQMLTLTRNILPNGVASTQAAFALRPRTPAKVLKQMVYKATRPQRNYQKQRVTLSGAYIENQTVAASATSPDSVVALHPGDQVVAAWLRVTLNSGPQPFGVIVNGTDQTTTLNGGWTNYPLILSLMPVASTDTAVARLSAAVKNNGSAASNYSLQLYVDVLR